MCIRLPRVDLGVGDVLLVDLDERLFAQAVDVRLVVALPGIFAGVFAQAILDGFEGRDFGREAGFHLEDVPAGLRFDRAENGAGGGIEDGLVEVGEELAAGDLAQVAAFIFRTGVGRSGGQFYEIAGARLFGQGVRALARGLDFRRIVGFDDDDFAQAGALGEAVAFLLAVVAFAQLFVGQLVALVQLAGEELGRQERVVEAPLHGAAGHAGLLQRLIERSVRLDAVLLLQARHRLLQFIGGNGKAEPVRAVFDEELGDEIGGKVLPQIVFLRSRFGGRGRSLLDLGEAFVQAARVLRAGDDAVADADDDRFDELGGRDCGRAGGEDECKNRFFHAFFSLTWKWGPRLLYGRRTTPPSGFIRFPTSGSRLCT